MLVSSTLLVLFTTSFIVVFYTGKQSFTCQQCGLSRDQQEIKKIASEIAQVLGKASVCLSSGRILHFESLLTRKTLLEFTEDALKSFIKAADILRITHGTRTPFMKELLHKLEEARAEVSYKLSASD
ncbi:hypothetical protein B296_00006339 [Ensete ventricosum]|uniref:Uncharacterized protein n=1 Tax=Ensete ventricosum TaxID=4639 RepID=A0A426ZC12_ENSVE|nr:hypothetical protein B296_00006339 [Ensete ventricosum]